MGDRGPIPRRSDARIRRNKPERELVEGESGAYTQSPYEPDEKWHTIAYETFVSFETSGQSRFFEDSDWMALYLLCEALSRDLQPQFIGFRELPTLWGEDSKGERVVVQSGGNQPILGTLPIKGSNLSAYRSWMNSLLATEGDRRRLQIELTKATPGGEGASELPAGVADLMAAMATKKNATG